MVCRTVTSGRFYRVYARFYEYEGTIPAMDSFQRYVTQYGTPLAVYADKHSTYRAPADPAREEQLTGAKPQSQFGRALGELRVELIPAHSPQAKWLVERLFHTFHDRLIKEMRLAGIATLDEANRFLETSLPLYITSALRSNRSPHPGAWSRRGLIIHGANACCRTDDHTQRRASHKPDISIFWRDRRRADEN